METDVRKILQSLADTAANAAEEAMTAAQSARRVVAGKYDAVKLAVELSRLTTQQERLFADIGRTMFLVQSGSLKADEPDKEGEGGKTPQQTIDVLLMNAAQLKLEMDNISEKLNAAKSEKICPKCGHVCEESDAFCAVCGEKL